MTRHKTILDQATALELGVSHPKVSQITSEFIRQLGLHLAQFGRVSIEGLGRFRVERMNHTTVCKLVTGRFQGGRYGSVRNVEVPSYIRVHFSKGLTLKKLLNELYTEETMEKYGVDESFDQEQLEKKSAEGCPECGRKLIRHGAILICPEHGSEPFETERGEK